MSANKWVGGTLIGLGVLTDAGAIAQGGQRRHNDSDYGSGGGSNAPSQAATLVVGTAALAGGLWLWNESPRGGQHRTRRGRSPRYTGRAR